MALVIIRAKDKDGINYRNNPKAKSLTRKYDVVEILDDGVNPGEAVCLPEYLVFQVEGKTRKDMLKYLMPGINKKRAFQFNFDAVIGQKGLDEIKNSNWLVKKINIKDIKCPVIPIRRI